MAARKTYDFSSVPCSGSEKHVCREKLVPRSPQSKTFLNEVSVSLKIVRRPHMSVRRRVLHKTLNIPVQLSLFI